jgi:asparagine synthase (glutamine-hydrolysing)
MPRLFGYTDTGGLFGNDHILKDMRDLLVYACECKSEPFYHVDGVHAGYCTPSFETADQHTFEADGIACWFDGEIYNIDELAESFSPPPSTSSIVSSPATVKGMMISAYRSGTLNNFLRKVDGYFSAVIHDTKKRQIKLITDRFGFRYVFYAIHNEKLIWASECKAFLAIPGFKTGVNRQSFDDFINYGMLCDDRTWLDGVYLLDAATVLTFDMCSGVVRKEEYWSPHEIKPLTGKTDIVGLYEEWGRLFKLSVAERTTERTGITLSGGLDSRAIFAAMPDLPGNEKINAVTFGDSRCDDVRIASAVAKIKGANHYTFPWKIDGWLERTFLGIWATDGALDLSAQLGIRQFDDISKLFGVCMNGIGGGPMQGGRALGSRLFLVHGRTDCGEPGLQTLCRRHCLPGFRLDESYFKVRMPFFDNDLYDFLMALPADANPSRTFYWRALLHNFPEYYRSIPWQQSGVPISLPAPLFEAGFFRNRVLSRVKRKLQGWGLPVFDSKLHFNTSTAMDWKGNREAAERILTDKSALWPDYISGGAGFLLNAGTKKLCRVLTFEIWMRLLNDRGFRERHLPRELS